MNTANSLALQFLLEELLQFFGPDKGAWVTVEPYYEVTEIETDRYEVKDDCLQVRERKDTSAPGRGQIAAGQKKLFSGN